MNTPDIPTKDKRTQKKNTHPVPQKDSDSIRKNLQTWSSTSLTVI